jgi:hypothetical protein
VSKPKTIEFFCIAEALCIQYIVPNTVDFGNAKHGPCRAKLAGSPDDT